MIRLLVISGGILVGTELLGRTAERSEDAIRAAGNTAIKVGVAGLATFVVLKSQKVI